MKLPPLSYDELFAFSAHCVSPRHCLFRAVLVVGKCSGWCAAGTCMGVAPLTGSPLDIRGSLVSLVSRHHVQLCCLLHSLVEDLKRTGGYWKTKHGKYRGFQHCNAAIRSFLNSAAPQRFKLAYWSSCLRAVPPPLQGTMLVLLFQQKYLLLLWSWNWKSLPSSCFILHLVQASAGNSSPFLHYCVSNQELQQHPKVRSDLFIHISNIHNTIKWSCATRDKGANKTDLSTVLARWQALFIQHHSLWALTEPHRALHKQRGWDRFHYEALSI